MAKDERNADERYDNLQRKENNIAAEKVANAFEFNDDNVKSVSLLDHGPLESLSDSEVSPVAETLQSSNAKALVSASNGPKPLHQNVFNIFFHSITK